MFGDPLTSSPSGAAPHSTFEQDTRPERRSAKAGCPGVRLASPPHPFPEECSWIRRSRASPRETETVGECRPQVQLSRWSPLTCQSLRRSSVEALLTVQSPVACPPFTSQVPSGPRWGGAAQGMGERVTLVETSGLHCRRRSLPHEFVDLQVYLQQAREVRGKRE